MDNGASSYLRFLDGDDSALTQIVEEYKDGLILYLNGYVKTLHTAEELMEETFFRIIVKKPRFFARYSFKTWLYTIARNIATDYIRKNSKIVPLEDFSYLPDEDGGPLKQLLLKEDKTAVHAALFKLKPEYRDALFLSYFAGLRNAEIAKVMGKSKSQVEMLVYRGKKALKSELCKGGFEYEGL